MLAHSCENHTWCLYLSPSCGEGSKTEAGRAVEGCGGLWSCNTSSFSLLAVEVGQ